MLVQTAETTLSPRSLAFSSVRRQVVPNGRAHFFDASQMKTIADLALSECKGGPSTAKWRRRIEAIDRSGRTFQGSSTSLSESPGAAWNFDHAPHRAAY